MLETVLKDCEEWKNNASSLLQDAQGLIGISDVHDGSIGSLSSRIECLVARIESVVKKGLDFGYDLNEIPRLEDACSLLQWCKKAISFCHSAHSLEVTTIFVSDMLVFYDNMISVGTLSCDYSDTNASCYVNYVSPNILLKI